MKNIDPTTTAAWEKLRNYFGEMRDKEMKDLFKEDGDRAEKFTIQWEDFYVDLSKNRITAEIKEALIQLAEECHLKEALDSYFKGDAINQTEARPVLHTALRAPKEAEVLVDGKNIIPDVFQAKKKIQEFSNKVIEGSHKGYTNLPITDVVNIGIGGSDLGPVMITEALKFCC